MGASQGMAVSRAVFLMAALLVALPYSAYARPTVRNVKTNAEFKKLLKHHAEVTGLPVVVYSLALIAAGSLIPSVFDVNRTPRQGIFFVLMHAVRQHTVV